MDLKLQVKQSQVLSQRMIQSAEILQMTSQELNTYINDLALENPVIDIVEPAAGDSQKESIEQQQWLNSFNEENYYLYQRQNNDDDYDFKDTWNINTDEGETLADYLWSQLISEDFSEQETEIIHFCLDSLDNRGYLTETQENAHTCYGGPDRQSPGYGSEKPDPGHCQSPPSFFRGSSRLLPDHQILKSKTGSIFQQP